MAASRSAVAVITMAFLPLVSACRRRVGSHERNSWAVAHAPVRTTASTPGWVSSRRPASSSGVGRKQRSFAGTPASWQQSARKRPTATVWGAGLRITPEPAARAASTPPAAMASGKFHGEATTVTR